MSIVGKFEAALAVGREIGDYGAGGRMVQQSLDAARISTLGVMPDIYEDVVRAYAKYGKGTGNRAKLNLGDCFSYAISRRHEMPLLYKGDDFVWTDVTAA